VGRGLLAAALVAALVALILCGCSATVSTPAPAMPADAYNLPTVLGPVNGLGTKTFTVTVRPAMSIELGCLGGAKGLAWVRGPIGGFAVVCGTPGNEAFAGGYDTAASLKQDKVKPGQRVSVLVTAPANDMWQLRISGGPAPVPLTGAMAKRGLNRAEPAYFLLLSFAEVTARLTCAVDGCFPLSKAHDDCTWPGLVSERAAAGEG
jgi:hypothetical protein